MDADGAHACGGVPGGVGSRGRPKELGMLLLKKGRGLLSSVASGRACAGDDGKPSSSLLDL